MSKKVYQEDEDFKQLKADLNEALEEEGIVVSEDLIKRTLQKIEQEEYTETKEEKGGIRNKYKRIGYVAASFLVLFVGWYCCRAFYDLGPKDMTEGENINFNISKNENGVSSESVKNGTKNKEAVQLEEKENYVNEAQSDATDMALENDTANKDTSPTQEIMKSPKGIQKIFDENIKTITILEKHKDLEKRIIKEENMNSIIKLLKGVSYKEETSKFSLGNEWLYKLDITTEEETYEIVCYSEWIVIISNEEEIIYKQNEMIQAVQEMLQMTE